MTEIQRPILAIRDHFTATAPAGMGLGWGNPVWALARQGGDAQTVLTPYGVTNDPNADWFPQYGVQIACWHPSKDTAEQRAMEAWQAYVAYQNMSSAATGLIFSASWACDLLQVRLDGFIPTSQIEPTGGFLYKAVVNLTLFNLTYTPPEST